MRRFLVMIVLAACEKDAPKPPEPQFHASCKPNATLDGLECTVENISRKPGRACVTAREQVPKKQPLVARRVCTGMLEPGGKMMFRPKFELAESLQPMCSPEG
ncbi:MAG TPA: hypothetical protein VK427_06625, partial [Kofleriaceae bacterium]|nr:hypothetical protein [Kofleriaceae bacterium]